jgi:hypothetical protein
VLLAVWVYVIVRTVKVAFTNDEAISYGIIHGAQTFVETANNQWLNTQLMRVSQYLFGQSELALRLPNAAAFCIYGVATIVLLSQAKRLEAKVLGFSLMVINPFLIEFFALARGYGLSLAFLAAAIACIFVGRPDMPLRRELGRLILIGLFGSLAFYANFSALNIVLGLLTVETVDLVVRALRRDLPLSNGFWVATVAIVVLTAASLVPGILQLRHLQALNQLYYGGHNSLISDTVGSLLRASSCGYDCTPAWLTVGEVLVVVLAALAFIWAAARYVHTRNWGDVQRAAMLFAIAILAVLFEAWLLGALYPIDRTALDYVVPFAVLAMFFVDDVTSRVPRKLLRIPVVATVGCFLVLAIVNFGKDANFTQATIWTFDASSRQVIEAVLAFERKHGRPLTSWKLISGFPRNEALNYYRLRFKMTWLQPVTREPISTPGGDFYYVGVAEMNELPQGTTFLKSFSDTNTQLRLASRVTNPNYH